MDGGSNPPRAICNNMGKEMAVEKPLWFKKSKEEIEALVVKLAKQGLPTTKIGLILRDSYGIPSTKLSGKKIGAILAEHGIKREPESLSDLTKKANQLKKHFEKNKQDKVAKRGLIVTKAKISKLAAYCKKKGLLPRNWKYE